MKLSVGPIPYLWDRATTLAIYESLWIYNDATLRLLSRRGAQRWVAPAELPLAIIAALAELRPANMEVEMLAYGGEYDIQAQSAAAHNPLPHIHKLRNAGVDVLRLSPHCRDFIAVISAFHDALAGQPDRSPNVSIASLDRNQRGDMARGF